MKRNEVKLKDKVLLKDGRILYIHMIDAGIPYGIEEKLKEPRFIQDQEWIEAKNIVKLVK